MSAHPSFRSYLFIPPSLFLSIRSNSPRSSVMDVSFPHSDWAVPHWYLFLFRAIFVGPIRLQRLLHSSYSSRTIIVLKLGPIFLDHQQDLPSISFWQTCTVGKFIHRPFSALLVDIQYLQVISPSLLQWNLRLRLSLDPSQGSMISCETLLFSPYIRCLGLIQNLYKMNMTSSPF